MYSWAIRGSTTKRNFSLGKTHPDPRFRRRWAMKRERREQDSVGVRQEGVERRKRDANFRRATGEGQALRCVPAIDWLAQPSIPSHQPSIRLVPCRPVCVLLGRSRKPWVAGQRPELSAQVARAPIPALRCRPFLASLSAPGGSRRLFSLAITVEGREDWMRIRWCGWLSGCDRWWEIARGSDRGGTDSGD
ncbi:hypothetical protein GGI43DRAFT_239453 [Trichoderma evansii]